MKTLTKRILLTVLGIPIFFSSIFFFPQAQYLFFTLICLGFSVLGSYEINQLISSSSAGKSLLHPLVVGLLPFSMYVELYLLPDVQVIFILYAAVMLFLLLKEVFTGKDDAFQNSISRMAVSIFHLIYPSMFVIFVIYMTSIGDAHIYIIFWFLMIFSNDVFAYVFGMLWGKRSRGITAVSPNKSLVGFIGGFASAVLMGFLFYTVITPMHSAGPVWLILLAAAAISIFADLGDLVESAIKRSSHAKDSGTIIPGRGGVLDTIDSIIFSAPVYILFLTYFLKV